jgi:hypothetical protein
MSRLPFFTLFGVLISSAPFAAPPPPEWAKLVPRSLQELGGIAYDVATDSLNHIHIHRL